MNPNYECCSARGGVVALDALTGKQIWKTYTIDETPHAVAKSSAGTMMWGPSGASIWSAPTIDPEHHRIYVGTGDNFSKPATKMSDAILALSMDTGKIEWATQLTENDAFNMACEPGAPKSSCPEDAGPDVDIGASPILVKLANGKRVLLVSQKSGIAHGLDPDHNGAVLWETRIGHGGALGGIAGGARPATGRTCMSRSATSISCARNLQRGSRCWWIPKPAADCSRWMRRLGRRCGPRLRRCAESGPIAALRNPRLSRRSRAWCSPDRSTATCARIRPRMARSLWDYDHRARVPDSQRHHGQRRIDGWSWSGGSRRDAVRPVGVRQLGRFARQRAAGVFGGREVGSW